MYIIRNDPDMAPLLDQMRRAGVTGPVVVPIGPGPGITFPSLPPKELSLEQYIKVTRLQIELIEREGLEMSEYYAGHLRQLSLALDPQEAAEEIDSLQKKIESISKARGSEYLPREAFSL